MKTYKSFAKLLIKISEHGNDFSGDGKLSEDEIRLFGDCIADIQNWCGENEQLLNKLGLAYDATSKIHNHF